MTRLFRAAAAAASVLVLGGCAGLSFNDAPQPGALTYFEAKPYLLITITKDCAYAASVVSLPGARRSVGMKSGLGSADLSVSLSNGMITTVGQKTDTKIPETLGAIAGLATAASKLSVASSTPAKASACQPEAELFEIVDGVPADHPIKQVEAKLIPDPGAGQ